MAREPRYPFLQLQLGQCVDVPTQDTPAQMTAAAYRASRQASDLLGAPVRFSVRRISPGMYRLTHVDPSAPAPLQPTSPAAETLTPEELLEREDAQYRDRVRKQLRQRLIRAEEEAALEDRLEELRAAAERRRLVRKAKAYVEVRAELNIINNQSAHEAEDRIEAKQREALAKERALASDTALRDIGLLDGDDESLEIPAELREAAARRRAQEAQAEAQIQAEIEKERSAL